MCAFPGHAKVRWTSNNHGRTVQMNPVLLCCGLAAAVLAILPASPLRAGEFADALTHGGAWLDLRYRLELVDQDNLPQHAGAQTLRSRAGYSTGAFRGFSALAEFEHIMHLGPERFNNGNAPGSNYPLVADPDTAEVNQAALRYEGPLKTFAILGRQRIAHDNERFIGDAGFRQNMQTFDAIALGSRALWATEIRYEYITRANRIFGRESAFGDWETDSHAVRVAWQGWRSGKLTGYGYFFDIDERPDQSSRTFGARWEARGFAWRQWRFSYDAEAARQSEFANRPGEYDAGYFLLLPNLSNGRLTLTAGYEVLGGDGSNAFTTPFATLHKFQGFTDVLDIPPPGGVRDIMAEINYQRADIAPLDVLRIWGGAHHFSAAGGASYGREYYAAGAITVHGTYVELKAAFYQAESFGMDTQKLWLTLARGF